VNIPAPHTAYGGARTGANMSAPRGMRADAYAYNRTGLDPGQLHKRTVRQENMLIFILLIGFYSISGAVSAIPSFVALFHEITIDTPYIIVDPDALTVRIREMSLKWVGLLSIVGMAASIPLFFVLRQKRLLTTDLTEKRSPMKAGAFVQIFVIAMGAQFVFIAISAAIEALLNLLDLSAFPTYMESTSVLHTPVGLLYATLLGPIMEEIIFRGAIMKHLERFGANYAIVMSSVFFGLYHIFLYQSAFAFLVGVLLGYTAHRYAIRWSMLLHILINSVALGLDILAGESVTGWIMFAIFPVSVFLLWKNRDAFKAQLRFGKPAMPKTFRHAFSGISVITMFGLFLLMNVFLMTSGMYGLQG
jgi:membrane protease YdiL (CAAX protease family)